MPRPGERPYWEISASVVQLKRDGKLDDALLLLMDCIEFTEQHAADKRAPLYSWPYDQATIVLRKQKRFADEVQIIERFLKRCAFQDVPKAADRLQKACQLAGQAELRAMDGLRVPYHLAEGCPIAERELFLRRGLVVDVETTGLSRDDELIELGGILFGFNSYTGQIRGVEQTYCGRREPRVPIARDAERIHGISRAQLRGCCLDDACVHNLFARADIVIAHNAAFDRRFIAQLYPEAESAAWFCTMNGIDWRSKGLSSKGLAAVAAAVGSGATQAHAGLADAHMVLDVLKATDGTTGVPYLKELLSGPGMSGRAPNAGAMQRPTTESMTIHIELQPEETGHLPEQEAVPKRSFWGRLLGKH